MKKTIATLMAGAMMLGLALTAEATPTIKHQTIKDCAVCHTKENAVAGDGRSK